MLADVDLPWIWNVGANTAMGECGLHSSLGGQLAALRSGITRQPTVDSSRAEDEQIKHTDAAHKIRCIKWRLAQLSEHHINVLWHHYGPGGAIIGGLSGSAVLCPAAAVFVGSAEVTRKYIKEAWKLAIKERRMQDLVDFEKAVIEFWQEAAIAYENAEPSRARKVWAE